MNKIKEIIDKIYFLEREADKLYEEYFALYEYLTPAEIVEVDELSKKLIICGEYDMEEVIKEIEQNEI